MYRATRSITGKILSITCMVTTLLLCNQPLQAKSGSFEMHIPDAILAQYMSAARENPKAQRFSLPLLRVFSKGGILIHESLGFSGKRQLRHELLRAMRRNRPIKGASVLASYLRDALGEDNRKYTPGEFQDADFVLVENWASWCAPCTLQHRALQKFLDSESDRNIILVHLETDIMRATRKPGSTTNGQMH